MIWLAAQLWGWMVLAAVAGAALTTVTSVRRRATTRWIEARPVDQPPTPADDRAPAATDTPAEPAEAELPVSAGSGSPFPEFRGESTCPAPWEAEEDWSRPRAAAF